MKITKAILTAAGRGTRFLPVSKAFQKEMVPIMEKPQLQWVIEETIESGITDIAVVVREGVDTLKNYLNYNRSLWKHLEKNHKVHLLDSWVNLKKKAKITLLYQKNNDPYGNGTPFIIAKNFVKGKPFAALWGDDIMVHTDKDKPTCLKQMMNYFEMYNPSAVMSAFKVKPDEIEKYGSYEYFGKKEERVPFQAKQLIEKPKREKAPSFMANACRFVLSYEIIEELERKIHGKGNEIWLTDAVNRLIQKRRIVMAPPWQGSKWVPVGDPIQWLKANIVVAMNEEKYRNDVVRILKEIKVYN